jgi:hypothetical protein
VITRAGGATTRCAPHPLTGRSRPAHTTLTIEAHAPLRGDKPDAFRRRRHQTRQVCPKTNGEEVVAMAIRDQEWRDVKDRPDHGASGATSADTQNLPGSPPEQHRSAVIEVYTRFNVFMQSLLMLVKTRITLDRESHTFPWGTSSFLVDAGAHDLEVSNNWLSRGRAGRAAAAVHVEAGETVRLRYQPHWLAFRPGKITVEGRTYGHQQIEPVVFAQDRHTRGGWRIVVVAVTVAATLVATVIGSNIGEWLVSDRSESDGWTTANAQGMSISLPRRFRVITDGADYAKQLAALGLFDTDASADEIEQFADLFALAALEPRPEEGPFAGGSIVVMRVPSGGRLDESAALFAEGIEDQGDYDITAEHDTAVGAGRYAAIRIDTAGHLQGRPSERSVTYIIDAGSLRWLVMFSALREGYDTMSPTFDRSIASLTLPTTQRTGR